MLQYLYQRSQAWLFPKCCTVQKPAVRYSPNLLSWCSFSWFLDYFSTVLRFTFNIFIYKNCYNPSTVAFLHKSWMQGNSVDIPLYLQVPLSSLKGKRSIFARQIAAQKLKEDEALKSSSAEAPQNPESRVQIPPSDTVDRE